MSIGRYTLRVVIERGIDRRPSAYIQGGEMENTAYIGNGPRRG